MKVKPKQLRRRPKSTESASKTPSPSVHPTPVLVMNTTNPAKYFALRTEHGGFVSISVQAKGDLEISATRLHSDERVVFRSNSAAPVRVARALFRALNFAITTEKPKRRLTDTTTDEESSRFSTSDVLRALQQKPSSEGWLLRRLGSSGPKDHARLSSLLDRVKQAGYVRQRGGRWTLTSDGAKRLG